MSNRIELCKVAQYLPIEKLKFHPTNPRTIRPERLEALKKSMIDKGFYTPILVWKKGGIVLSGNHRLLAAQQLTNDGWSFTSPDGKVGVLPVVVEDVSEEVANAILFETNNSYAEWVDDKLRSALKSAQDKGQEIAAFGFDQTYIDQLLASAVKEADERVGKADRLIEPPTEDAIKKAVAGENLEKEQAYLVLQKSAHEQLQGVLQRIAQAVNDSWVVGDDLTEAAIVLCQAINESGFIEDIEAKLS